MINETKEEYIKLVNRYYQLILSDTELIRVLPDVKCIKIALQNLSNNGKNDLDQINSELIDLENFISRDMANNNSINKDMVMEQIRKAKDGNINNDDTFKMNTKDWIEKEFENIIGNLPFHIKNNEDITRNIQSKLQNYAKHFKSEYEEKIKDQLIQKIASKINHNLEEYEAKRINDNMASMESERMKLDANILSDEPVRNENLERYNTTKKLLDEGSPLNKTANKVEMLEALPSNIL